MRQALLAILQVVIAEIQIAFYAEHPVAVQFVHYVDAEVEEWVFQQLCFLSRTNYSFACGEHSAKVEAYGKALQGVGFLRCYGMG